MEIDDTAFPLQVGSLQEGDKENVVTISRVGKKDYAISWNSLAHIEVKAKGIFMNVEVYGDVSDFGNAHWNDGTFWNRRNA